MTPVPVLLYADMVTGAEKLLKCRNKFVTEGNVYIFGKAWKRSHQVGHKALRLVTASIDDKLQNKSSLTSTSIRKYIATVPQVILCII